MIKKLFSAQTVSKASVVLVAASILSYFAGLLRDKILSYYFGTSVATDSYNMAFLVPDFLFNLLVAGAITAVFIPVFSGYLQKNKEEAFEIASTFLNIAFIVVFTVSVIVYIFIPQIIDLVFSEIDTDSQRDLVINLTRILLVSPIFFSLSNTLGSILISYKHFSAYAYSAVLYNIGIIIGIVLFHNQIGIYSAAVGAGIGVVFHFLLRFINIFSVDFKYKPIINLKNPGFIKIVKLMMPKTAGLLSWQINLIVYNKIALAFLSHGSIAAFYYARNLQSLPVSLFGIAFATSVFPFLSDSVSSGNHSDFIYNFRKTLQRILFFALPSAIGMFYLSKPFIEIILSGGEFDEESIILTSSVLTVFALSIPIESMIHLFARGFYAYKNTLTPVIFALTAMVVNISIAYYVSQIIGVQAFSLSFLAGSSIQLLLLAIFIRKKLHSFETKVFILSTIKQLTACGFMLLSLYLIPKLFVLPTLPTFALQVVVGSLIFFGAAFLFKCEEVNQVKKVLIKNY